MLTCQELQKVDKVLRHNIAWSHMLTLASPTTSSWSAYHRR